MLKLSLLHLPNKTHSLPLSPQTTLTIPYVYRFRHIMSLPSVCLIQIKSAKERWFWSNAQFLIPYLQCDPLDWTGPREATWKNAGLAVFIHPVLWHPMAYPFSSDFPNRSCNPGSSCPPTSDINHICPTKGCQDLESIFPDTQTGRRKQELLPCLHPWFKSPELLSALYGLLAIKTYSGTADDLLLLMKLLDNSGEGLVA